MAETYEADVAILGAGPAGTAAAAHLGELGVRRVVLVDRHDFPRDKTCGSAISPKGIEVLKDLGVWKDVVPEAYWIRGIRIVTRGGRESWQSAGDVAEAIVCNRRVLDHLLLKRAQERGATFLANFDARDALFEGGDEEGGRMVGFRARDGREVRARHVFIAGGSHCRIGLPELRPRKTIQAIMGWWEGVDFRPNHVEMIFDRIIEPYYGWLFPEGEDRVNIGITYEDDVRPDGTVVKKNARELFAEFLDLHYADRIKDAKRIGPLKGHPIVWSRRVERLTASGRFILGESGLMTHPATAEGIYQGMKSGMLAAGAAADILSGRKPEPEAQAWYERECKRTFQNSFVAGDLFRHVLKTDALDLLVAAANQPLMRSASAKLLAHI